jgi:hypothetical protein
MKPANYVPNENARDGDRSDSVREFQAIDAAFTVGTEGGNLRTGEKEESEEAARRPPLKDSLISPWQGPGQTFPPISAVYHWGGKVMLCRRGSRSQNCQPITRFQRATYWLS